VLIPFLDRGCDCVGIELDEAKSGYARELLAGPITEGRCDIVNQNIYEEAALTRYQGRFDLILLKDVIEHIPDQERFMGFLKAFLAPGGKVFFAFPPWYMPFGGHQQICKNKWLSRLPYYHNLPKPLYRWLLQTGGEPADRVQELLEIKDTGISIERFERILRQKGYAVLLRRIYLLNPIYFFKFGLKPRIQTPLISVIPYLRDFISTAVYYLIEPK
jgi:SAM-dependent methyltransferase